MNHEKSCGAVIYTLCHGEIRYLLIQNRKGVYGFSKGHVEPGETERETAGREIWEETGLKVTFLEGFRHAETYLVEKKPDTDKEVVYFVATYADQMPVIQQSELSSAALYTFAEATELLIFGNRRQILIEADAFIRENLQPAQ